MSLELQLVRQKRYRRNDDLIEVDKITVITRITTNPESVIGIEIIRSRIQKDGIRKESVVAEMRSANVLPNNLITRSIVEFHKKSSQFPCYLRRYGIRCYRYSPSNSKPVKPNWTNWNCLEVGWNSFPHKRLLWKALLRNHYLRHSTVKTGFQSSEAAISIAPTTGGRYIGCIAEARIVRPHQSPNGKRVRSIGR